MSKCPWARGQGVPCPCPVTAGIGSSKNPCDPIQTMDGWTFKPYGVTLSYFAMTFKATPFSGYICSSILIQLYGLHESTWQPFCKALTSANRPERCWDFEKQWGILCLITVLVKWCLTSLTMPSGSGADTISGEEWMLLASLKIKWLPCYLCS